MRSPRWDTTIQSAGEVFNIGNDREISIYGLAQMVKERASSHSEIVFIPYDQAYEVGFEDMRRRVPDVSKIHAAIGWQPTTSLETTVDQIITFYRDKS